MATHCKARPLIMNLREPGSAPPTPWQCEMAAVASTLRKLLPAAGRAGTPPRTLWWGAGYSDLPAECAREIGSEAIFADSDPRRLRRSKAMAGDQPNLAMPQNVQIAG